MQPSDTSEFLAIIDCFDGPEGRNIALVSPDARSWRYVTTFHGARKRVLAGGLEKVTRLELFGVRIELEASVNACYLVVKVEGESEATYRDGVARRWQGADGERRRVDPKALGALRSVLTPTAAPEEAQAA